MAGCQYDIIATDISTAYSKKPRAASIRSLKSSVVAITLMLKYFKQLPDNTWQAMNIARDGIVPQCEPAAAFYVTGVV